MNKLYLDDTLLLCFKTDFVLHNRARDDIFSPLTYVITCSIGELLIAYMAFWITEKNSKYFNENSWQNEEVCVRRIGRILVIGSRTLIREVFFRIEKKMEYLNAFPIMTTWMRSWWRPKKIIAIRWVKRITMAFYVGCWHLVSSS